MQKKPRLGQNFLVDANAGRAVAAALGNIADQMVLEIGPGRGAITHLLAPVIANGTGSLTLVEFDPTLAASLAQEYSRRPSIEVLHADILTVDLTALAQQRRQKLVVVGNLPYYITSDILLHLVAHHAFIDRALLMVQREVAERVTAQPGTRDYGVLSATMQLYGSADLLFTLPPTAFAPPPEVYSSVFRWHIAPLFEELHVRPETFIPFLRACFSQKRKTLANNLRAAGYAPPAITDALIAAGLHASIRAEAVDLIQMAAVFHSLGIRD